MKKYLMFGLAALAFASCSKNDFEPYSPEQIVKAEFDAKFISEFGQPASNQNWGFGSGTRAFTRGVFANGNEWAANDRSDCMYRVPPRLTEDQIKVVKKYFQTVKNPGYEDPQWTNYFIQQVYKGGTDALTGTNPTYGEPYSPEQYTAANGSTKIVGSTHMDHLAAIDKTQNPEFVDHNNNFNSGDCGNGYPNVLDFKGTLTTVEETYPVNDATHRHSDKINLMLNSTTKSFGYYNSTGSVRRTEYTGLVSFQTIINALGAEANCLNDGWNRSFMGFDFEMMIGDDLYQDDASSADGKRYVKLSDIPGNKPQYIWDGERVIKWYEPIIENWQVVGYEFAEGYDEYIRINGQKIPYLSTNTSMYAGSRLDAQTVLTDITQSNQKIYKDYNEEIKNVECLNLPLFQAAFEAGYYPTKDSNTDWVKVGGTADGYYSDWIVTLTEAKKYDVSTVTYEGRIMVEDLTVQSSSDWDFNDAVFDYGFENGTAHILLRAAGGTLPLCIGGSVDANGDPILDAQGNVAGAREVHDLFGLTNTTTMVNTGAGATHDPVPFDLTDKNYTSNDQILISVKKKVNGQEKWIAIPAVVGQPAGKFVTNTTVDWVDEYANIKGAYPQFTTWVTNGTGRFEPTQKNDVYFNRVTRDEPALAE